MANYSITYFKKGTHELSYVDSRTYPNVQNSIIRAVMHLNAHEELEGAAVIYQGKKVQKRVRTIQFWNHDPKHQ